MLRGIVGCVVLSSCAIFKTPPDAYDTSTVVDPYTETGDDTGTDTQTGDDTGEVDTGTAFDCDQQVLPGQTIDECVTRRIECGETILATTVAATDVMDREEYEEWFCTPFPAGDYNGNERIYQFTHPGTGTVTIDLLSPCSELDLFVVRWEFWDTDRTCPTEAHGISECEIDESKAGGSIDIWDANESHYLIIVDGPEPVEDIFEVSLSCPDK